MKDISTLVPDILALFGEDKVDLSTQSAAGFLTALSLKIKTKMEETRGPAKLRLSNLGKACNKQLWLAINEPASVEPLPPAAKVKFLYGDILEEMLLWLAKEAGHTVEREQETVTLFGVVGHIDAVIDGILVDCKSASTASFGKFKNHLDASVDDFGYLTQLDSYMHAVGVTRGGFLAIDKTLGHICLDLHDRTDCDYALLIEEKRVMLASERPPERAFTDVADGASGNKKLGTACSYCASKKTCWPGLRTFAYANGPRFLTEVRRKPEVPEV